jgi:hypothetical protein
MKNQKRFKSESFSIHFQHAKHRISATFLVEDFFLCSNLKSNVM